MAAECMNGFDTGFVSLGYAKVAILGVVQGITELMPISSTAHMRLVPWALGWRDPGSAFSAAMQLAALAAVVSYFWSDVRGLVFGSLSATVRRDWRDRNFQFALAIVLGTIPIVFFGKLLEPVLNACNSPLRALVVIGWASLGMSLLLALAEMTARHKRRMEDWDILDVIIVGICQAGALIPGVSRSGSTLTAALFLGFNRAEAARFSFLLGLPAITWPGLMELSSCATPVSMRMAGACSPWASWSPAFQPSRQYGASCAFWSVFRRGRSWFTAHSWARLWSAAFTWAG